MGARKYCAEDKSTITMIDKNTVHWTACMGDMIALAGGAVYLAKQMGHLILPYDSVNESSTREIYRDHPEIELITTRQALKQVQSLGFIPLDMGLSFEYEDDERAKFHGDDFQFFYWRKGIPYTERWKSSPILKAAISVEQIPVPRSEYAFVHEDPVRGFGIDWKFGLPIVRPASHGRTILAHKALIENATEVHVIDSAFFHLAEQIDPKGKLFFHRYARGNYQYPRNDYLTKHDWIIIE